MGNTLRGNWQRCIMPLILASALVQPALGQEALAPLPAPPPSSQVLPIAADDPFLVGTDTPLQEPTAHKNSLVLQASWDHGIQLETENHEVRLHFGGAGQLDTVWLIGPQSLFAAPGGNLSNGVGNAEATFLRRAILEVDGSFFEQVDFKLEYDFANASNDNSGEQPPSFQNLTSSPTPLNIWMQVRDVPVLGYVRVGNQVKPIGMENNTDARFLPFMERSDNHDAFYAPFDNGFSLGIAAQNWTENERMTWRYGIFQPATNGFGVALNKYTAGARLTALPWYSDDGAQLIHLGLGYWGGEIVQDELRDRARPLLRNAPGFAVPVLVDTSEVPGSRQYTLGPEFAMVFGPLTIQAEYAGQWLTDALASNGSNQGTIFYHGGYAEALFFLTGEHQDYLRREGVFGRVVPLQNYQWKKGDNLLACGAWQIGVRFSYLDLNDKAIQGGEIYDWTVGLNWYLNANAKVQVNYIAEHRDNTPGVPDGWINGVGARVAFDF
jgi:phosphate-selective porin OprO and OprP